ncbi:hypothetical protein [Boseongicola sp. H5]|uniref:hypothetical protein n=1 Tax=Boseongicola sp. H5 TaxID=2763261 RepID=UPI001D0B1B35|nr:hypothetical protein [Boseongicola sp. H5]
MKEEHIPTRQIDGKGVISGDLFLSLPCRLYSLTGGWYYRTIHDEAELLEFLHEHRKTDGAFFDVQLVWQYYCEQRGDVIYSCADHRLHSKHDTRNLMVGFEGDY